MPVNVTAIALSPSSIGGGGPSTGTVTIAEAAAEGGAGVLLTSADPNAVVPARLIIPAGSTAGQFSISTGSVTTTVVARITAAGTAGDSRIADLTITPLSVIALTFEPATAVGRSTASGTVTLNAPALSPGATVALISSGPEADVPSTVTVPYNQSSAQFPITVGATYTALIVTLSASTGTTPAKTAQLHVMPAPPPEVVSIDTGSVPTYMYTRGALAVNFSGATPDREVVVTRLARLALNCEFVEFGDTSGSVPATPDGQSYVAFGGTFKPVNTSNPLQVDTVCNFQIFFKWRASGGDGIWRNKMRERALTIRGHEVVTVADTSRLQNWLRPRVPTLTALPACAGGIKSHNGKLAFELTATALGADCPFELMNSDGRYPGHADYNFNLMAEGVVLSDMHWTVENHGSGCCLGFSANQACAPLPFPPVLKYGIAAARSLAAANGGAIKSPQHEWEARGFRACDGYDPEGNVIQVRELNR